MRAIDPNLRDDLLLAGLMMLVAVPRVLIALVADRPIGVEGTLALLCLALALVILVRRIQRRART